MKNLIFQAVSLAVLLVGMGVTYAAWTTLTASQGASGQPVNQTLVQGIINNINDVNTRATTLATNLSNLSTTVTAVNNQLDTVNPTGTTLSGSSVCINGDCQTSWPNGGATGGMPSASIASIPCNSSHLNEIGWGIAVDSTSTCNTWDDGGWCTSTVVTGTSAYVAKYQCVYEKPATYFPAKYYWKLLGAI